MVSKSRKVIRKASQKRYDKTSGKRANKRKADSDKAARASGWNSYSEFTTWVINGRIKLPTKPPQKPSGEML